MSYQRDRADSPGSQVRTSTFSQTYMMEYKGYLYSRRLMNYVINANLTRSDIKSQTGSFESRNKTDSPSINFKLSFLEGTRYPFYVYKDRANTAVTALSSGSATTTVSQTDRYGLNGSYALRDKRTTFRYDLKRDVTKSNTDFGGAAGGSALETNHDSLRLGMDRMLQTAKSKNAGMLSAHYVYDQTRDKISNQYNSTQNLDASLGGLKPSKDSTFSINSAYAHDNPSKMTTVTSNISSSYSPSARFSLNSSLYMSQVDDPNTSSNYSSLFTGSTYRINEYLTTNQNLMLYRSLSNSGAETTETLSLGVNFSKTVLYGVNLFANTNAGGSADQRTGQKHIDSNNYSGSAGMSKNIAFRRTQVTMRGTYSITGSHPGGTTKAYTAGSSFMFKLFTNMTLQSNIDVNETESVSNNISTITKTTTMSNSLSYSAPIGLRGTLGLSAGANFTSGSTESRSFNSNMNLSYMLLRGVSLKGSAGYTEDSVSDSSAVNTSLGLDYNRKKFSVNLNNTLTKNMSATGKTLNVSTSLKASRYF